MTPGPREIPYRLRWDAGGHRPGAHRSRQGDAGLAFRGHRRLVDGGDPRRLDIHASLRDPLGQWWVRTLAERRAVTVVLLADLSASMDDDTPPPRVQALAALADSLAWSAQRLGDAFGCLGADRALHRLGPWPPTRQRGCGPVLAQALQAHRRQGAQAAGIDGLLAAVAELPRQRCLVFLASDFHWPAATLGAVMDALAPHDVVPVVLWQRRDFELPARDGLAWLQDAEGHGAHLVWVRPALRLRHADRLAQARQALTERLRAWQRQPVFQIDGFDPDAFAVHFQA
ncbi:DUF58 domain-containing protein [Ideonella sp. 4Y11]|uniref:DUF58 domain-containing protein n=1 Tax=Ideonella aquatica TaxID=2824119 RepID=A0A940YE75_9BURK|nr:DUF58 domain-containing protein [Ideonella aquatica]MBQ0958520.1 DUF58 domain-containing protein [Ideonella aquatica]